MSSSYSVWAWRMQEQRRAEQASEERRHLALRAQVERDQAAGVAMRRNMHDAQYVAQCNHSTAQHVAQQNNNESQFAAQRNQAERAYTAQILRAREAQIDGAFRSIEHYKASVREGQIRQRRDQHMAEHRATVARHIRSPTFIYGIFGR